MKIEDPPLPRQYKSIPPQNRKMVVICNQIITKKEKKVSRATGESNYVLCTLHDIVLWTLR